MALRKSGSISKKAITFSIIFSIFWLFIYIYELSYSSVITLDKGLVLILIFIGWLVPITMRSMK
jgi:hypothetical protein